jgi:pimeloyl-ACP methyl ester carboxylesterase
MPSFVLVHGACAGGWYWRWVMPYLHAAGFEAIAPTLTGLGERAHLATPEVDLDTHIQDIVAVYEFEDLRDTVLVGHSYGGMVVAGVADRLPDRVAQLIYLDSDVPRDGDTSVPPRRHAARVERARAEGDGWRVPPPTSYFEDQLATLPDVERMWFLERLTMHPLKTWLQPIRLTGAAATLPTSYIRCLVGYDPDDEDTRRQDARIRSEPTWRYREIDAPHMALATYPAEVAAILLEVATTVRPMESGSNGCMP